MHDTERRLTRCFAAVFPDLNAAELHRASTSTVASWDSLAAITLVSLIEEEFAVQIPVPDLAELTSFKLVLAYLEQPMGAAVAGQA